MRDNDLKDYLFFYDGLKDYLKSKYFYVSGLEVEKLSLWIFLIASFFLINIFGVFSAYNKTDETDYFFIYIFIPCFLAFILAVYLGLKARSQSHDSKRINEYIETEEKIIKSLLEKEKLKK